MPLGDASMPQMKMQGQGNFTSTLPKSYPGIGCICLAFSTTVSPKSFMSQIMRQNLAGDVTV